MKKIFKKLILLMCVLSLFSFPSIASAQQITTPVPISNTDTIKEFEFQPYSLNIESGQAYELLNTTDSNLVWKVKAGETFVFVAHVMHSIPVRLVVYTSTGIVHDQTTTSTNPQFAILPKEQDAYYHIMVIPAANSYITSFIAFFN